MKKTLGTQMNEAKLLEAQKKKMGRTRTAKSLGTFQRAPDRNCAISQTGTVSTQA